MLLRNLLCLLVIHVVHSKVSESLPNKEKHIEEMVVNPPPGSLVAPRPATETGTTTAPPVATTTGAPKQTPTWTSEDTPGTTSGRLLGFLQRISERLASLEALQVENTRRLEGIDYRVTRIEVQIKEKMDSLSLNVQESSRRTISMETELARIDSALDFIRDETTATRGAQSELKAMFANYQHSAQPPREAVVVEESSAPRLQQAILSGVNNIKTLATNLRDQMVGLGKNLTLIANTTKMLEKASLECATKNDLNKGFVSLRQDSISPARSFQQLIVTPFAGTQPQAEKTSLPKDCGEALRLGAKTGIQRILPDSATSPFFVYCDMDTRNGGWTVIQNRFDGSVNFLREWADYKHGFGNLATEFWLGLEKIHMLTNQGVYELLIELTDFALNSASAHYSAFAIGSEVEGYDLRLLGRYEGDAGDSLSYHSSMKFSTIDMDQDLWLEGNCARDHTGGWWYRTCDTSNLNGQYLTGNVPASYEYKGMYWYDYNGPQYSLMKARMLVRQAGNTAAPEQTTPTTTVAPARREDRKDTMKPKRKKDIEN